MMQEEDSKFTGSLGKPIISSRLPKAFSQPKHLTHKKIHGHQDLSAANEFKNVRKLLSPLKKSSPESSALRKVIHKLSSFPNVSLSTPSNGMQTEMLMQSLVKLEEMITISILKSSYRSGIVRKSLHAPSLKLFALKEVPVSTFMIRQKLLETIKSWQSIQKNARYLVEVNSSFWNSPEGCVTIVMEYMPGDSLSKLCESIGAVPEKVLRGIANRILSAISYYHKKIGPHGGIDITQIMFTRHGKAKLGLGLSSRLHLKEEGNNKKVCNFEEDVFDLGVALISASIGGADWLNECFSLGGECCLLHSCMICSELPYVHRFSAEFCEFLCKATKYDKEKRAKINDLLMHSWIKSDEPVGASVTIQELLGMSVNCGGKESFENLEKQISMLIESLQVVLSGWNDFKSFSNNNVKELCLEFGISTEVLNEKLKATFGISENSFKLEKSR